MASPETCAWHWIVTILKNFADASPLVLAAPVPLHVGEHPALVGPKVVLGAKEEDGKLPNLVA